MTKLNSVQFLRKGDYPNIFTIHYKSSFYEKNYVDTNYSFVVLSLSMCESIYIAVKKQEHFDHVELIN